MQHMVILLWLPYVKCNVEMNLLIELLYHNLSTAILLLYRMWKSDCMQHNEKHLKQRLDLNET